jgi:amino acid adenylation domain-containing protein
MSERTRTFSELPPDQQAIRARCFHPGGTFIDFKKEEIEQSIPFRFEQIVQKYSDRLAIKTKSHQLTYGMLNRTVNRVARAILEKRGEGKEPVALLLEKDAPMVAAILGVLKADKIYMPLDPTYPRARMTVMLEDSQAGLIVTNNRNLNLAGEIASHKRLLINFDELNSGLSGENVGLVISPNNLASILYTSGSTGEPKGVVQNHRNILYKTRTYTNNLRFCADDRISLLSPCTFSLSVGFVFGALLNGACLYPVELREEGSTRLATWLTQEGITIYNAVPTAFRSFIDTLTTQEHFLKLRLIHMGGAATRRDVELYKKHFAPDCIMVHDLGSNESGTIAQYFIDHTTQIHGNTVPAGYAVEGGEILVLDDGGNTLQRDHVGEIALKSRYVALGYWRNPYLTRAVFSPDPAGGEERIYRTGDQGLMRPDGCLEYLGRKDFQVKIRGHRVEIAEIEMALLELVAIKEAVVVALKEAPDEKRLVAYVVSNQKPHLTVSELRQFLKGKFPEFMVPSAFVFMDALPLTPSGKADRQALRAPDWTEFKAGTNFVLPRNHLEKIIAGIWQDVLQLEKVGVYDNFFDLGGHSLLMFAVHNKLQALTDQELSVIELLKHPTISSLAQFLGQVETVESPSQGVERALSRRANMGRQKQFRHENRTKARQSGSEDE